MSKQTGKSRRTAFSFDGALADLETLVEQLESGQLSLEEALSVFEKGVKLTRQCQQALDKAQQRVETLVEQQGFTASDTAATRDAEMAWEDDEEDDDSEEV